MMALVQESAKPLHLRVSTVTKGKARGCGNGACKHGFMLNFVDLLRGRHIVGRKNYRDAHILTC